MKKLIVLMALALVMALSGSALAQQQNQDWGAYEKQWQKHSQTMSEIQDKLWAKNMEYEALANNPNADREDINEIINEITKLRGQMRAEYDKFASEQGGRDFGPGYGYGPGMGGGYGMGYGCPGGGWGGGGRGWGGHHRGGWGRGGGHRNWY